MIPTSVHLAPRCGLGTKVPRPMANLGGQESLVVLLERKDGPEKLAGQCTGQYLRNPRMGDRKSTCLNSSHGYISYAVFCLKKKIAACAALLCLSLVASQRSPRARK